MGGWEHTVVPQGSFFLLTVPGKEISKGGTGVDHEGTPVFSSGNTLTGKMRERREAVRVREPEVFHGKT